MGSEDRAQTTKALQVRACYLGGRPLIKNERVMLRGFGRPDMAAIVQDCRPLECSFSGFVESRVGAGTLSHVQLELQEPIFVEAYDKDALLGGFVMFDPESREAIAAAMVSATDDRRSPYRMEISHADS